MFAKCCVFLFMLVAVVRATQVNKCSGGQPFPLAVRVEGCEIPPCDIIKGRNTIFEIDLVVFKYTTELTTKVKATTLGLTVPYDLPDDVSAVCPNLKYGAYCPLYPTEDVTYLFVFPIGNYPEISVKVEIYLEDQDKEIATCFVCSIKVKKGSGRANETTVYELDFLEN